MTLSKSHYALILPHSLMYFPQSFAHSQTFKTNKKACLLSLSEDSTFYLINTHHVPRDRQGGRGGAEWFSLSLTLFSFLTQLNREWIKGLTWAWTHVPPLSLKQSRSPSVTTAMTNHSPPSLILTQVRPVRNLINSVNAAGVWPLVTIFAVCLTPFASKTRINTESH